MMVERARDDGERSHESGDVRECELLPNSSSNINEIFESPYTLSR